VDQAHKKDHFNIRSFGSDVLIYSSGQILLLIFGLVQSLIIPKYLSTADYGYWQLFLLYTNYVGILHLGFLDGILVRWAGKNLEDLIEEIPMAFRFILLEQGIVIGTLILIIGITDLPSKALALAVLINAVIVNLLTFFLFTAQATKRFKHVTTANVGKGLIFLIAVLLTFFCGHINYFPLIFANMITGLSIAFLFAFYLRDYLHLQVAHTKSLLHYGKENIAIGFFILLGNFVALIIVTTDRIIVGSFFPITQFAVYAFAMTMCGLATVFLQAVALVFLPYLSESGREIRTRAYSLLRPALVLFWAGILAVYFPFSAWIRYYLPHYADSLPLMAILLCTVGFSGQINILHANFFKVYRKQRAYFVLAGVSLIIAIILSLLAVSFFGTLTAVAAMAVISFSIWYLLNETALRDLVAISVREVIKWALVICAYISAFLGICTVTETWTWSIRLGIYLVMFSGITTVCLHAEAEYLWCQVKKIYSRRNEPYDT